MLLSLEFRTLDAGNLDGRQSLPGHRANKIIIITKLVFCYYNYYYFFLACSLDSIIPLLFSDHTSHMFAYRVEGLKTAV